MFLPSVSKYSVTAVVVIIEVIILALLVVWTLQRAISFRFVANVLSSSELVYPASEKLEYFYVPMPDSVHTDEDAWLPKTARQTITQQGFNERYVYATSTPKNTKRILTLGNSFTYGMYVDTEDNYSEQLEDSFALACAFPENKVEVINAGVTGYDAEYASEFYRTHAKQFKPDIVVWMMNQGLTTINEIMVPINTECKAEVGEDEYNKVLEDGSVTHSCSYKAMTALNERMTFEDMIEYHRNNIENLIEDRDTAWVFVVMPYDVKEVKSYLQNLAEANENVYFYELPDSVTNSEFLLPDEHPNPLGHQNIAEHIKHFLTSQNLVSCG